MSDGASLAPIMKRVVVKEELRDDVVSARLHLGFQVVELVQRVGRFRMSFRKSCDTDAKSSAPMDTKARTFIANEAHKIRCVPEVSKRMELRARWRVTSERENGLDPVDRVELEDSSNVVSRVTHTGEMGNWFERRFSADPQDKGVCLIASRSSRTIGHAHK